MRLTFGDMTREVKVFNLEKQPHDVKDQTFEVNLIENLTSKHREELELKSDYDFELESEDFNLDQIVESAMNWASNPISPNVEPINLTPPSNEPSESTPRGEGVNRCKANLMTNDAEFKNYLQHT